jgi:hypothetical protein
MEMYEQKSKPLSESPLDKSESTSMKITWPASWGTTLLAIWLVVTGIVILLAPANAVLVSLNAILAIAAGVLLFLGK